LRVKILKYILFFYYKTKDKFEDEFRDSKGNKKTFSKEKFYPKAKQTNITNLIAETNKNKHVNATGVIKNNIISSNKTPVSNHAQFTEFSNYITYFNIV